MSERTEQEIEKLAKEIFSVAGTTPLDGCRRISEFILERYVPKFSMLPVREALRFSIEPIKSAIRLLEEEGYNRETIEPKRNMLKRLEVALILLDKLGVKSE